MSTGEASSPPAAIPSPADTPRKPRLIRDILFPPLRLFAEILYHQIIKDQTFTQAAALTYKTLFSLLPIFVLSLLILSAISNGSGSNALDTAVRRVMFEQLSLDKLQMMDNTGHPMIDHEGNPVTLASYAEHLIDKAKQTLNAKLTGLIAFAILVYGALSLMIVIESTFNLIYGGMVSRSWPRRIMLYWCVLTLGPIGIACSIVLGNSAYTQASGYLGAPWAQPALRALSGLAVSYVLVVLMYRLIPGTRVKWKSALLGALVGAGLWEICKWGFGFYVQRSLHGLNWYGSLALLPLFMLWIYLTWSVILIGLHVAYLHQYYPLLKRQIFFRRMGRSAISDLRWVLPLGVLLYRRFKQGQTTFAYDASEKLLLPTDATAQLLAALEDAGLVHGTKSGGYALARPPATITAYDLLAAVRALTKGPPELVQAQSPKGPLASDNPRIPALDELEKIETRWSQAHTLPTLAGDS